MLTLKGTYCYLRALEPEDLDFLYEIENDENVWEVSETITPYSKFILKQYLENSHRDIFDVKQLRLAIVTGKEELCGFVDIFDFDPKNLKAGVGIIVKKTKRGKGFGAEALNLVVTYCFKKLNLHQIYANISEDNKPSISLFEKLGFKLSGIKTDWTLIDGTYKNELLFQKINS
ncbi:GNAT family N-acetyltransferase [Neptunitalea lumnitzerae]|uniref:Acetyltransferase n=1 Tax=Neptunitalea lumnitzerae TaxID=2965509 RepID=A0ABQ5MK67_9FLAO|nr:GNAT family N-acetyltransferase [Neptunitalea sp. Y10]GLB49815.1 acetyltransferase [Neptunitalea sp. Y10]